MNATGFNHAQFEELAAAFDSQANIITERGENTLRSLSALTTDGLQGNAAESTRGLADEVMKTSELARQTVNDLRARSGQFGESMTNSDNSFASRIAGA